MLLWADNPDYYATAQIPLIYALGGTLTSQVTVQSANGRRGSNDSLFFDEGNGSVTAIRTFNPSGAKCIWGFAIYITVEDTSVNPYTNFAIGDATVWHIGMVRENDNTFGFYNGRPLISSGGGTLIGYTNIALSLNTWYHISVETTINDTTGTLSCKINGAETLNGGAGFTNIDTRNGGTAGWTRIGIGTSDTSMSFRINDVTVADGSGSVNNTHLGDCSVLVDIPNAVNGSNTGFTPNGGTFHGDRVREIPLDEDTTYNASTAVGQRDTYVFPSLTMSAGTPIGVINRMALKKTEAGTATAVGVIYDISAATNYDGAVSLAPSEGSYAYFDDLREQDPDTSAAWTVAGINDKEFGVKRAT